MFNLQACQMTVTFFVNSYATPTNLWCILGSLIQQTDPSWEAVVLLNHRDPLIRAEHRAIVGLMDDDRLSTADSWHDQLSWDCYWACDWAYDQGLAKGEWICCASDDGYYMPEFVEVMAASDADVVFCDMVMRKYLVQRRSLVNTLPKAGHIDKTGFMVRRSKWIGFPHKNQQHAGPSGADGMAVESMVRLGYKVDKVHIPLVVHN